MAWGCFCWIPCPYKKWNEDNRAAMVAMLPLVGACMGVITAGLWRLLSFTDISPLLMGAVVTALYFLLTGFIHLDGYMDCCDAVLPRHPDPERRRQILKDPHNGAFGIISLAIMMMLFFASAAEMSESIRPWHLIALPVMLTISRGCSASCVLSQEPMETSQYDSLKERSRAKAIPAFFLMALIAAAGIVILALTEGGKGDGQIAALVAVAVVTFLAAEVTGAIDRKALGGMSGDISGHMIVTSEMFGMLAAAAATGLM